MESKGININLNKGSTLKKLLPWAIIAGLFVFMFFKSCGGPNKEMQETRVEYDTLYVEKTIPGDTITIVQTEFIPVGEEENKQLREIISKLKNDKERLNYLLAELTVKTYDSTYKFEKGKLTITDTVQGTLLGRSVDLEIFPVKYKESIVNKTVYKYPKWAITGGIETGINTDFQSLFKDPYMGLNLGLRNANGVEFEVGYDTNKVLSFELSKDLFVNY